MAAWGLFHKPGPFLDGDRGSNCTFLLRQSNEPGSARGKQFGNPRRWLETCRLGVALRSVLTFPSPRNFATVSLVPDSSWFMLHSKPEYFKPALFRSKWTPACLFLYVCLIFSLFFSLTMMG